MKFTYKFSLMKKIIKSFKNLKKDLQEDLYRCYSEGELERAVFPYNGTLEQGVLYTDNEVVYLVPISSIIASKSIMKYDFDAGSLGMDTGYAGD